MSSSRASVKKIKHGFQVSVRFASLTEEDIEKTVEDKATLLLIKTIKTL